MTGKWEVEDALSESGLPPMTRLVVYDLLRRADAGNAAIPAQFSPGLASIARTTGLGLSTVKRHLNIAESEGWATRTRNPDAPSLHAPTGYSMHVPPRPAETLGPERAKGARPRAGQGLGPENREARPTAGHNQTITRPKPDQKKKSRPATDPYTDLPGFADFWDAYPRNVAKAAAAKAYRRALSRCGDAQLILKGAAAYRDQPGRVAEFTKHPATWLNGDCWLDDPLPATGTPACDRDGPGRHSDACRRADSRSCTSTWCQCRCHDRNPAASAVPEHAISANETGNVAELHPIEPPEQAGADGYRPEPRGFCPVCGGTVSVMVSGTLRRHKNDRSRWCEGAGRPPLAEAAS